MSYPKILKIELTNHCDANCIHCSNNLIKPKGYMSLDMFKAIIDDFPKVKRVTPQWFGESALHPQFYEALKYAKRKGKSISFYTNGYCIDPHKLAQVGIEQVKFSVEADNKELHEKIRKGLKWEVVYNNIMEFQKIKGKTRTTVRMTVMEENRNRIKEIKKFWSKRVDSVVLYNEHSANRQVEGSYKDITSCDKPSELMVIGWNGDYILCCTDYERKTVVANVKDGARKAWDKGVKLRENVKNGKMLPACKDCGFVHTAYLTKVKL